jgi:phenazine biosynthesis protein PhzF family
MKKYRYKKVNAFTSGTSNGNPAAYLIIDDGELSKEEMLKIGKEHSGFVSEVVFCTHSDIADIKLTYYSSECEVDFCGHGTIATMYDLISCDNKLKLKNEIMIETNKKGILKVYNSLKEEDAVYITAPKAKQLNLNVSVEQIADALDIHSNEIDEKYSVDFIDAGLRTLIVPISKYEKEISIYPDEAKLKKFCMDNEIDIILIFSKTASSEQYIAHTRVFAPKFGYLEDPATGSGNSAFASYLLKNDVWDGSQIMIEQGGDNIAFNTVKLKMKEDQILFGGKANVIIEGVYYVN